MTTPSALTQGYAGSSRVISTPLRPLAAGAKVYKGGIACVITASTGQGYFKQGAASGVLRAVGVWLQDADNTNGAAGAVSAQIDYGKERTVQLFANDDSGTAVTVASREQVCYVCNDQTVTGASSTQRAGIVYDVDSEGVWVEIGARDYGTNDSTLSDTAPTDPSSSSASAGSATEASRRDHKHHIAVATTSTEGLMSAAQCTQLGHGAAPDIMLGTIAATDATVDVAEYPIYVATGAETFTAFKLVPNDALTGANTNYKSIIVSKRDGAGGGASAMATLTTVAANGDWTAFTPVNMGTVTGGAVAAGYVITLKTTHAANGKALPLFTLYGVATIA